MYYFFIILIKLADIFKSLCLCLGLYLGLYLCLCLNTCLISTLKIYKILNFLSF